jgi:hypothetical protein
VGQYWIGADTHYELAVQVRAELVIAVEGYIAVASSVSRCSLECSDAGMRTVATDPSRPVAVVLANVFD